MTGSMQNVMSVASVSDPRLASKAGTRTAHQAAKTRGVKLGRKPKLTRQQVQQAVKLISQGERPADVAVSFHVGRTTLYRALAIWRGLRED